MVAMQLISPDHSRPGGSTAAVERKSERSGTLPAGQVTAQFQPLDPSIVNEAIPAFFIGRNKEGFWVAREVKGQIGGLFLLKNSALSFARSNSRLGGCATIFPSERFELDLENNGNPLVVHLGSLMRLAKQGWQRIAAFTGKMKKAVERRMEGLHVL